MAALIAFVPFLFGKNTSRTRSKIVQSISTNVESVNRQSCEIQESESISGIRERVINSTVGNISVGIDSVSYYKDGCMINTGVTTSVKSIADSISKQESSASGGLFQFGDNKSIDDSLLSSTIDTYIKQVTDNACKIDEQKSIDDVVITIKNSVAKGDIRVEIKTQNDPTCSLVTMSKMDISSREKSNSSQKATTEGGLAGLGKSLLYMIIIVVVLCVVAGVIIFMSRVFLKNKPEQTQGRKEAKNVELQPVPRPPEGSRPILESRPSERPRTISESRQSEGSQVRTNSGQSESSTTEKSNSGNTDFLQQLQVALQQVQSTSGEARNTLESVNQTVSSGKETVDSIKSTLGGKKANLGKEALKEESPGNLLKTAENVVEGTGGASEAVEAVGAETGGILGSVGTVLGEAAAVVEADPALLEAALLV